MLNGINKTGQEYKNYTGIGAVKILAVNPTNEEYKELTNNQYRFDLTYNLIERDNEEVRPIFFLVKDINSNKYEFIKFYISSLNDIASTGSEHKIDSKGRFAYVKEGSDLSYFDINNSKVLKQGERAFHVFLQRYAKYSNSAENANWLNDMEKAGITSEKLLKDDLKGLKKLINWFNDKTQNPNGFSVGILWTIKETPKKEIKNLKIK